MSSELQLDVRNLNRWRRHLVNAYEVKAGMVFIAGKTVRSMPERFKVVCIPYKALYKCSAFLPFCFKRLHTHKSFFRSTFYTVSQKKTSPTFL